ncbi:MAG: bacteriophage abortive infection AbiH family protein, partial [Roseburia sp.]|nr:bacteriophage abortive infection AbiH family protein [Roseburia sp.]
MKTLVIIGNGFDLNLGLKTSYRHFVESEECRTLLSKGHNYLLKTILGKYHLCNWVDIEEELKFIARTSKGWKIKKG